MQWMRDFYVGDQAMPSVKRLVRRVKHNRPQPDVYLLTLASNPRNQIDIFRADFLRQPFFRKPFFKRNDGIIVIGLGRGYDDALDLMLRITDECFRKTGSGDIRAFLLEKIRKEGMSR